MVFPKVVAGLATFPIFALFMAPAVVAPAVLALAPAAPASADEASFDDPAARVDETVLANGLRVYTLEDHSTPVVSFQIWVQVGSKDETRYTGLAHLFEHMMFKGSKRLGPEEHAQWIQRRGGRMNAFTSRDVTVYHEDITAESLPLVIDLEAERFGSLDLSDRMLESEREVVLEERRLRYEDRPNGRAYEALSALAWQAHPYRHPVIGWRSDVAEVPLEACRDFFDTYYAPNNYRIVIVGDFDTAETLAHVERAFGGFERGPEVVRPVRREPEQRGERRSTVTFEVQAPLVYAAWHAPKAGHEDSVTLDVASLVLSGGRSSRLYRALVYDEPLVNSVHAYYIEYMHAGLLYATAAVRPGGSIDAAEARMFEVIEEAAREGVELDEVEKAKRQLEVSLVGGLGTAHATADRIGREMSLFARVRPLAERIAEIRAVSAEDVQRALRKVIRTDQRSVVRLVPPTGEETP
ncbi:MAG: pitrilysin family protein [Myxococcota bacterium]|jgi:predicted Zn-dependent peptidase|nr:pitrilysin family protein [Myxococcota bacterium]